MSLAKGTDMYFGVCLIFNTYLKSLKCRDRLCSDLCHFILHSLHHVVVDLLVQNFVDLGMQTQVLQQPVNHHANSENEEIIRLIKLSVFFFIRKWLIDGLMRTEICSVVTSRQLVFFFFFLVTMGLYAFQLQFPIKLLLKHYNHLSLAADPCTSWWSRSQSKTFLRIHGNSTTVDSFMSVGSASSREAAAKLEITWNHYFLKRLTWRHIVDTGPATYRDLFIIAKKWYHFQMIPLNDVFCVLLKYINDDNERIIFSVIQLSDWHAWSITTQLLLHCRHVKLKSMYGPHNDIQRLKNCQRAAVWKYSKLFKCS